MCSLNSRLDPQEIQLQDLDLDTRESEYPNQSNCPQSDAFHENSKNRTKSKVSNSLYLINSYTYYSISEEERSKWLQLEMNEKFRTPCTVIDLDSGTVERSNSSLGISKEHLCKRANFSSLKELILFFNKCKGCQFQRDINLKKKQKGKNFVDWRNKSNKNIISSFSTFWNGLLFHKLPYHIKYYPSSGVISCDVLRLLMELKGNLNY